MTIKELPQLIVQVSSMAENEEIFLLDMGQTVKIIDLANQMVQLSGLSVKDKNQNRDIEIKITRIRAGENFIKNF